jgi:hypothetical protein
MSLRCLFSHRSTRIVFNRGIAFTTCGDCAQELIRVPTSNWYPIPSGYVVRWKTAGTHAARPERLITIARRAAPLAQRLSSRRTRRSGYFL